MTIDKIRCETRRYTEKAHVHHHPYSQLILPLEGTLSLKTTSFHLEVDEEHLFFLPPSCSHAFHSNCKNKFLVLDIPPNNLLATENTLNKEVYQDLDERWKAIRYLLLEESRRPDRGGITPLVGYIFGFLMEEKKPLSLQYIHDNLDKPIQVEKLASLENFHPSYYIEWFTRKTGLTPKAYIQKLRLEKAKEYLQNSQLSLLMVAQNVGYNQQSSLTRLFKNLEGITPQEYRKKFGISKY